MSHEAHQAVWSAQFTEAFEIPGGRRVEHPTVKFVMLGMANYADPTGGNIWPALSTLSKYTGFDRSTIQRAIDAALTAGLLVVQARATGKRRTVTYRLILSRWRDFHTIDPEPSQLSAEQMELSTEGGPGQQSPRATYGPGQHSVPPRATLTAAPGHPEGCPGPPEPLINHHLNVNEPRTGPVEAPAAIIDDDAHGSGSLDPRPPSLDEIARARAVLDAHLPPAMRDQLAARRASKLALEDGGAA